MLSAAMFENGSGDASRGAMLLSCSHALTKVDQSRSSVASICPQGKRWHVALYANLMLATVNRTNGA